MVGGAAGAGEARTAGKNREEPSLFRYVHVFHPLRRGPHRLFVQLPHRTSHRRQDGDHHRHGDVHPGILRRGAPAEARAAQGVLLPVGGLAVERHGHAGGLQQCDGARRLQPRHQLHVCARVPHLQACEDRPPLQSGGVCEAAPGDDGVRAELLPEPLLVHSLGCVHLLHLCPLPGAAPHAVSPGGSRSGRGGEGAPPRQLRLRAAHAPDAVQGGHRRR
mmetsp:Transcript_30386/g.90053  ORF Transcript_30386/g.90053 Transcript_30386/m.90053 type:complete len:219 (+) Transcript_30386:333-989(+)